MLGVMVVGEEEKGVWGSQGWGGAPGPGCTALLVPRRGDPLKGGALRVEWGGAGVWPSHSTDLI